tara:strand:+ start:8845 stop:9645 length:801 start_codon:yes stop_codon:yes gene_type:complete
LDLNTNFKIDYCQSLANRINEFEDCNSILEIGIGEATTLGVLKGMLKKEFNFSGGFDISWSRLNFAKNFLSDIGYFKDSIFCADLFNIPLKDNSIDVVYTSHSLEPNGGREDEALSEILRIASKYVVLLEPIYENESKEVKQRMDEHGYIKGLYKIIKNKNLNVIEFKRFELSQNELNPTSIIVIEKSRTGKSNGTNFVCPVTKNELTRHENSFYSQTGCLSYPIIKNIPCLLGENAIMTSNFNYDYEKFKSDNNITNLKKKVKLK